MIRALPVDGTRHGQGPFNLLRFYFFELGNFG